MSTYKLYYFNGRGRAEICRLVFAAAGEKFEDIRYEQDQWPSHKADMPLSQLPVLEFDGTKLPQSMSIARFLAKQFHLAGKDNFEQAKVDAVVDTINDTLTNFLSTYYEKDETKKQELQKKYFAEELPKHLQNLENLGKLYGNGGSYFVGNHLTWTDLYFYVASEYLLE
jgi:glutathione S-transferase